MVLQEGQTAVLGNHAGILEVIPLPGFRAVGGVVETLAAFPCVSCGALSPERSCRKTERLAWYWENRRALLAADWGRSA